jgi:hypothetical protein
LGEAVHPATGITGPRGSTRIGVAEEHLPEQLRGRGRSYVTGGTYRIRVSHPTAEIPAAFSEETTVGEEIAADTVRDSVTVDVQ